MEKINPECSPEEIRYVSRFDEEYPDKLSCISDPPAGLYVRGRLPDEDRPSVAIIGSRLCSQYGRLCAESFGRELALAGVQVISGLARGIDGIAQYAAASAGGASFGILGCGVDVVYPRQNREIYDKVLSSGGLISEFPPGQPPLPACFAQRNRIISGLCDILLVVEAKERSGTQITVRNALEQGKDIYAVPGRINDVCSAGCNEMIAGGAGIALSVQVILEALGISGGCDEAVRAEGLDADERKVYDALDLYPRSMDAIAAACGMPMQKLTGILFRLIMKEFVKEEGKNHYVRTGF